MVSVSRFYGIDIQMYFDEHNPPHFHAVYGECKIRVSINPIQVLEGSAPRRVVSMVLEWAALHQTELENNWEAQRRGESPKHLSPLE